MRSRGGAGAWFFVALPDHDAAGPVADRLLARADVVGRHPSGRPWLLACLPAAHVLVHDEGPRRLALLGSFAVAPERLARVSDEVRSVGDATEVSARFAGAYCVAGSLDGRVYVQGTAMGVHRIFHALVDGVRVACDRADVLAELAGAPMDETALALRLVRSLPHPFPEAPPWREVAPVAPGDYLTLERDGRGWSRGTWWRRPEPRSSRAEGAAGLRDALEAAVGARTASGGPITCDLSGGMDSTPLCYFAARGPGGVLARTMYNDDPGGKEDLAWARRALPAMPGVREHLVQSSDGLPGFFGGLLDVRTRFDLPSQAAMAGPRVACMLGDDVARGITAHLNGVGGDHLLRGLGPWEHSLFRARPLAGWRRARAVHAPEGLGIAATLRELLDGSSYPTWLRRNIARALAGAPRSEIPRISDWSTPPRLPPWLSADARAMVAAAFRETAGAATPLGPDRAAHLELFLLREGARIARGLGQLGPPFGVAYDAPLLDDHVAEAVLAVRREERDTPVEWKPLMKAAMTGLLPAEFLRRTSKVGGSAQAVRGIADHHGELLALFEESGLPASGLVDPDGLAAALRPDAKAMPPAHVFEAVNMAVFLRNQVTAAGPAGACGQGRGR
ncbi:asparagine synthase-related protein [Nonomuraea candida]|uniref:asparagine synthase-related protein n=1 Tax=Nonomuraea candida TaxID=359159 RepID=UPI0006936D3B|nr:asparagine synthase-related protein [Nonomuraea candida]